ncbi:MAG TPA: ribosome maturation factor RimP [Solirubrobacteraceae bacterium]|nr:ribosome maturation factor RimP [Solirubrobacteraceae bacterium]
MSAPQSEIEERLAASEPDVEVLLAETLPNGTLRVFIDHPDGVTLGLCERVTELLSEMRERYALEVSSPGTERPLTKPTHFRRYVGRRARVLADLRSVRESRPVPATGSAAAKRRAKSFTGELVGVTDSEITLAADGGIVAIPYSEIRRSNLVEE